MAATQFIHVQVGQTFHCGIDKDGSVILWEKNTIGTAVCREVRGRFTNRWIGVVDNFFSFDRVWVMQ